jgi:hypothetical protein
LHLFQQRVSTRYFFGGFCLGQRCRNMLVFMSKHRLRRNVVLLRYISIRRSRSQHFVNIGAAGMLAYGAGAWHP